MADRARTIFLGSGPFALPALLELTGSPVIELAGVVTAPARPSGRRGQLRRTLVAEAAAGSSTSILEPRSLRDRETLGELTALEPDLIVLADYGRLVPRNVLELPRHGALNLHPSVLPRHRGASPVAAAILFGDRETGVTLMRMDEGLDTGPIVAQVRLALHGDEVAPELEARLAGMAAALLGETLPAWLDGLIEAVPPPADGATLTRPLRREDARLDATRGAVELERQVRAYQPWPGSFVEQDGTRLIVWKATDAAHAESEIAAPPAAGALVPVDDGVALVTVSGWLRLDEVQPAGGRRMSGAAYRHGRPM
ncbi:methionyl-tRNA formyltransferase [soil metagenome]